MTISIKIARPNDASNLAHIMIAAWRSGFRGILPEETIEKYTQLDPCLNLFHQILTSGIGTMYLASLDGQPVGLLYRLEGENRTSRIEALLTCPEAWGKGVAAALMGHCISDVKAAGCTALHVWPFAENYRALRFYQKQGFTPSGASRQGDALELEYIHTL